MISDSVSTAATADRPDGPAPGDGVTVRRVATLAEYHECLAIQQETWGAGFREIVPPSILLVAQQLGGVCAGAFARDGRMLGFVFGMTGMRRGRLAHWSDMLAVRAEARGAHLGERLKYFQRDLVRALGVETMYWTFDPLVARNAHLNLNRLGARIVEYVPDMYGSNTGSTLHGTLATDRVIVAWNLMGDGGASDLPARNGRPEASRVRIAVPRDADAEPLERRAAWRAVTREAFVTCLQRGYEVVGFRRGDAGELPSYELSLPNAAD